MSEVITYDEKSGELSCSCGNTSHTHGFVPVNEALAEVEPTPQLWHGRYMCQNCGVTIVLPDPKEETPWCP